MRLLLDGATGTALQAAGMPAGVCTEQWIVEHPAALQELQRRYAAAGCDVLYAPTFGANRARLKPFGLENQVAELNRRLVALTREAAPGCKIAGNLSPTGLLVEPYDEWEEESDPARLLSMQEAVDIFAEQVEALQAAGVDLIVAETMTSLNEARAALLAARRTGLPVFVTIAVNEEGHALSGTSLLPCVITLQAMGATAVGVNCCTPAAAREELEAALPYAQVPLIAKPCGTGFSPLRFGEAMGELLAAGAVIVGGCCGTLPEHMAVLRGVLDDFPTIVAPEVDGNAAAGEREAFFLAEDLDPTPPLPCDSNLADAFIEAEEDYNVARVHVAATEDIPVLLEAAQVCRLPIALYTDDALVLDETLLRFPGRLLVDSLCEIETELLEDIASHYGAVVF